MQPERRVEAPPPRACRTCGAPIYWARMINKEGRPAVLAPVDAEPHPQGTIQLTMRPDGTIKGEVVVPLPLLGGLRRSHFATCPQAAQHRKERA